MNEAKPFDVILVISESLGDFKTYLNTTLSLSGKQLTVPYSNPFSDI